MANRADYEVHEVLSFSEKVCYYGGVRLGDQRPILLKQIRGDLDSIPLYPWQSEFDQVHQARLNSVPEVIETLENSSDGWLILNRPPGKLLSRHITERNHQVLFVLQVALNLAQGLRQMHEKGFLHLCLEPQSILVHDLSAEITLLDFSQTKYILPGQQIYVAEGRLQHLLPYIAPEQTGLLHCSVDHRADLYSLGVIFYEMITGAPPFAEKRQEELILAKLKEPIPSMHSMPLGFPSQFLRIVHQLLALRPTDRYLSAAGLVMDLQHTLLDLKKGDMPKFPLSIKEPCPRFFFPSDLYGRDQELSVIQLALDCALEGQAQVVLISGEAGIGKTRLIQQIRSPLALRGGLFLQFEPDQRTRYIPYYGVLQAFRSFLQPLLEGDLPQREEWKERILSYLGTDLGVLCELLPELGCLLRWQSKLQLQREADQKNQIYHALTRLVEALASAERPLVFCIDDLHYLDESSLVWIQTLLNHSQQYNLLILGAYQPSLIETNQSLLTCVEGGKKRGLNLTEIALKGLNYEGVNAFIADLLNQPGEKLSRLTESLLEQTQGSPFLLKQVLKKQYEEGKIYFSRSRGCWHWSSAEQYQAVLPFGEQRLKALKSASLEAYHLLTEASTLGRAFRIGDLLDFYQGDKKKVWDGLKIPALTDWLVFEPIFKRRSNAALLAQREEREGYCFLSNENYLALRESIDPRQKAQWHLRLGKMLLKEEVAASFPEPFFTALYHLNQGELVADRAEKGKLLQANQKAVEVCLRLGAYAEGDYYLRQARNLGDALKASKVEALYLERLELELRYKTGALNFVEQKAKELLSANLSKSLRFDTVLLLLRVLVERARLQEASQLGVEEWPIWGEARALRRNRPFWKKMRAKRVQDFLSISEAKSVVAAWAAPLEIQAPMRLLGVLLQVNQSLGDEDFCEVIALEILSRTVQNGVVEESIEALMQLGCLWVRRAALRSWGVRLASEAIRLAEQGELRGLLPRLKISFVQDILQWSGPAALSLPYLKEAGQTALDQGDCEQAKQAAVLTFYFSHLMGKPLFESLRYYETRRKLISRPTDPSTQEGFYALKQSLVQFLNHHRQEQLEYGDSIRLTSEGGALTHYIAQGRLWYFFGYHDLARQSFAQAKKRVQQQQNHPLLIDFYFFSGLNCQALLHSSTWLKGWGLQAELRHCLKQLAKWATPWPQVYLRRKLLLLAGQAQWRNHRLVASQLYDRAIEEALGSENLSDIALAYELAAKNCVSGRLRQHAKGFLEKARHYYRLYGAVGKIRQLEEEAENYKISELATGSLALPASNQTDAYALLFASHALSREICYRPFIEVVLKVMVENSGAQKGEVFSYNEEGLSSLGKLTGSLLKMEVEPKPLHRRTDLPWEVVNDQAKQGESLVRLRPSESMRKHKPLGMMIFPIVMEGKTRFVVYLEFTQLPIDCSPDRVNLVKTLSLQISDHFARVLRHEKLQESLRDVNRKLSFQHRLAQVEDGLVWFRPNEPGEKAEHVKALLGKEVCFMATSGPTPSIWLKPKGRGWLMCMLTIQGMDSVGEEFALRLGMLFSRLPLDQATPEELFALIGAEVKKQNWEREAKGLSFALLEYNPDSKQCAIAGEGMGLWLEKQGKVKNLRLGTGLGATSSLSMRLKKNQRLFIVNLNKDPHGWEQRLESCILENLTTGAEQLKSSLQQADQEGALPVGMALVGICPSS